MNKRIKLLFLCTGNSCRSQMAEGFARHYKSDVIEAYSAGVETHGMNPKAVKVMAELGIDISGQRSQHIDEFKDISLDVVITVCEHAHETCPVFPGHSKTIHYGFEDPPKLAKALAEQGASEEEQLDCYRKVRDEIGAFVQSLPDALESLARS
ncbi:MAG: arsenate reductase ArsC [Bradymonadales bacterium]|jgi:arsenate reductase